MKLTSSLPRFRLLLLPLIFLPAIVQLKAGIYTPEPWPVTVVAPILEKSQIPTIDGIIDESEWAGATRLVGTFKDDKSFDPRDATAWFACDGETLYVAMQTETAPGNDIVTKTQPDPPNDVLGAISDDSIEIYFAPDRSAPNGRIYMVGVNSAGACYDTVYDEASSNKEDKSYRIQWDTASKVSEDKWNFEAAIPLSAFGLKRLDPEKSIGLRLVRNWKRPDLQADFVPRTGAFKSPSTMLDCRFHADAPLVRMMGLRDKEATGPDIEMEISNPSAEPMDLVIDGYSLSVGNPERLIDEHFTLAPGSAKTVVLAPLNSGGGYFRNHFKVSSGDGKKVFFSRKWEWLSQKPVDEDLWEVRPRRENSLDLTFGYYPSFNTIKARLDTSMLKDKAREGDAFLRVVRSSDSKVLASGKFPPPQKNVSELILETPPLPDGAYFVEASLAGEDESDFLVRKEFVRKHYEWENNQIGISDQVIPPYTPLVVSGRKVSAVLREYEFNPLGLLDQVTSENQKLLAEPMRFEVVINGAKQVPEVVKALDFTVKKPGEVVADSAWRAGELSVQMHSIMEYDGMLKVEMRFRMGNPEATLDKFDLVIPLLPEAAPMLEALSEGCRNSFIDMLPAGENLVWESKFMDRQSHPDPDGGIGRFPGTFIPYVWLGNERQGLAWFADNDRDWLPDDERSTHAIYRKDGKTLLRIRFVTRPGPLKREHVIVFGLQATPTKPVSPDWRKVICAAKPDVAGLKDIRILGSGYQWGCMTPFSSVYPRNRDMGFMEVLKTARTGTFPTESLAKWIEGYDPAHPHLERLKRGVNIGVGLVLNKPDVIIPYFDARGIPYIDEEFQTFQDEWTIFPYNPSRKWPTSLLNSDRWGYEASIPKSRADYILWYYDKLLDTGAVDSIYFDVTYLRAVRQTVSAGAYVDENGKLRPSCELFALRDLFKRCAVLTQEKRGYNFNVSHMTHAEIAPLQTWFGVNLDWESHYGTDDFQDRFKRELIRTTTLGQHCGTIPLVLGSIGFKGDNLSEKEKVRVLRTLAGCVLAHEIKDWAGGWGKDQTYNQALRILYNFGYGESDCQAYNYWQQNYPAEVRGIDSASLVLAKGGEALVVITDYGSGGKGSLTLDDKVLKLNPTGKFYNAESGEVLPGQGNTCNFDIKKHDFLIIHYR